MYRYRCINRSLRVSASFPSDDPDSREISAHHTSNAAKPSTISTSRTTTFAETLGDYSVISGDALALDGSVYGGSCTVLDYGFSFFERDCY